MISNIRSIATVGMNGSIDFLCYSEFDSPTIFAALLEEDQGRGLQIEPCLTNANMPEYLPDTNISESLAQRKIGNPAGITIDRAGRNTTK